MTTEVIDFDKAEEAKRELARRELARRRYIHFVQRFSPDYQAGWVHKEIAEKLEQFKADVEAKKSPRLMIFMPPRHGKSQLTSKTYAAWVLGHHPTWEFMECSYSSALASAFSRNVRGIIRDPAYQAMFPFTLLDPSTQAVDEWMTTKGGQMVAAGVGGPITGKGAHIMLIDDPVKNREEAESPTTREAIWDWYTSTAYTRLAPGGGVLVIQTRWHDDDLSGRLITAMAEAGDQWEVIQYPAIALEDEAHRAKGEALHPERYDEAALKQIRRVVGDRDWWALYQQQPVSDDGAYFTQDMFPYYQPEDLPPVEDLVFYTAWDLAIGTKEHNDWTVGITVGIDREENLWVVDLQRGHWNGLEIVEKTIDTWMRWKALVTGIEKGQIQMAIGALMQKRISERKAWAMYIEELKTGRRDKSARARSIQGLMGQKRVKFPHPDTSPWVSALVSECLRFPVAAHDDQVDALAWVGQMIVEMTPSPPPRPEKQKSWKDKLGPYIVGGSNRHWLGA